MMYRQVLIAPEQQTFQRIFWGENPSDPLKVFTLNRVTYGTAGGSYLATRPLRQIADEIRETKPIIANVIDKNIYVDDVVTGSDSVEELIAIRKDLTSVLSSARFELRKFSSNNSAILEGMSNISDDLQVLNFKEYENHKALGILWNPSTDFIQFLVDKSKFIEIKPTKRNILSVIASIFDPLGLISPIIIKAKILIQSLWEENLDWDTVIPENLRLFWLEVRDNFDELNSLRIPRHVVIANPITNEFHGFCDASKGAYGACIYIRSIDRLNNIQTNLLIAKSKVAPLRKITLPRLELCGAYLLSNLSVKVLNSMSTLVLNRKFYWTDSTIALSWIKSSPNRWKTFVANRVAAVQEATNIDDWYHIDSCNNPADIVSRGSTPAALVHSNLWWHGPSMLASSDLNVENTAETSFNFT